VTTFNFTTATASVVTTQLSTTSPTPLNGTINFTDQGINFTFSFAAQNVQSVVAGFNATSDQVFGAFSDPSSGSGIRSFVLNPTPTGATTGVSFLSNPVLEITFFLGNTLTIQFGTGTAAFTVSGITGPTTVTGPTGIAYSEIKFTFSGANSTGTFFLDTLTADLVCFLEGTNIATPNGDKPVDELDAGDLITTADGSTTPIRWVGVQEVSPTFATPQRDYPIRIRANALQDGVPSRDLYVTGEHALFVDGLLINAGALVNGTSITRVADMGRETFRYYHIETDAHDLVLAENTPAETFVDYVTRGRFQNHAEYEALYGDEAHIPEMDVPRVSTARLVPQETRVRLAERAEALGHKIAVRAA